jgi:hypothetical protein
LFKKITLKKCKNKPKPHGALQIILKNRNPKSIGWPGTIVVYDTISKC